MMEVEKISSIVTNNYYNYDDDDDDDDVALPGFRFHPTDEELVGFYLRRKVENKEISLQLIKQIDIYKYDPWDLPKGSGDKEWYFYCKRGRKYKNSLRPNRVTGGSGFWKATGIDRPIYSSNYNGKCIGLKKSLVYYKGSAGKGTKTDWQMHEFRLPDTHKSTKHLHANTIPQQAETWTLCRILKRNASYRKSIPDWKGVAKKQRNDQVVNVDALSSKLCSNNTIDSSNNSQIYISFSSTPTVKQNTCTNVTENKHQFVGQQSSAGSPSQSTTAAAASSASSPLDFNEWLEHGNWDELKSIFDLSLDPFS